MLRAAALLALLTRPATAAPACDRLAEVFASTVAFAPHSFDWPQPSTFPHPGIPLTRALAPIMHAPKHEPVSFLIGAATLTVSGGCDCDNEVGDCACGLSYHAAGKAASGTQAQSSGDGSQTLKDLWCVEDMLFTLKDAGATNVLSLWDLAGRRAYDWFAVEDRAPLAGAIGSFAGMRIGVKGKTFLFHGPKGEAALRFADNEWAVYPREAGLGRKGDSPNARDAWGRTPLHDAAARCDLAAVKLLTAAGGRPFDKDEEGLTAPRLAAAAGCPDVERWLKTPHK
jgi:hypothetical protein